MNSNRSEGSSPRRVHSSTEGKETPNLLPTTITPTALAAVTTAETMSSSGSVVSITSHASASTTSIGSRGDDSDGGKSRSSFSCSSGLGSVWGVEDVVEDIGPQGMARCSEDSEDDCAASVSTAGSTDDGCLDAFLVDTDSGSDTGEGMSDVSSISSHGFSHGSGMSQSMHRNVAINTTFNKGFAQRRSVQDPLYHINPIIVPSPSPPSSSPMQTTPSSPDRGGVRKSSTSIAVGIPVSIAINASMTMESTDLQASHTNDHRDDNENGGGGIVLVGLGEEVLQDLRGCFRSREEHKSPLKRVW